MPRVRTGSIDEVAGGFRVRMTLPCGDRKPLGTYPTWKEAEAVRLAALEALDVEGGGDLARLRDWGNDWIEKRERDKAIRDTEHYRRYWTLHVLTHDIADMPLKGIRPSHLDDLVSSCRAKGLAAHSIRKVLVVVRGALKAAFRRGLLKVDPFAGGVPIPKDNRTVEPWTFATPEEQDRIVASCTGPIRHLIAFAMATGLRAGELVSLRLVDVHEDRIVVRYGSPPDVTTKSGKIRTVFFNGRAKEAWKAWLAELPTYTASKRYPDGRNPLGLAFPGAHGGFRSEAHVIRWACWKKILEGAQIGRRFRWHDLRHTCASSLVSGWWGRRWSLEEVREVLGHSSIDITQRYAHLASDAMAIAAKETNGTSTKQVAPRGNFSMSGEDLLASELAKQEPPIADLPIFMAPPARFERATSALGRDRASAVTLELSGDRGQLRTLLLELLVAAAQGDGATATAKLDEVRRAARLDTVSHAVSVAAELLEQLEAESTDEKIA